PGLHGVRRGRQAGHRAHRRARRRHLPPHAEPGNEHLPGVQLRRTAARLLHDTKERLGARALRALTETLDGAEGLFPARRVASLGEAPAAALSGTSRHARPTTQRNPSARRADKRRVQAHATLLAMDPALAAEGFRPLRRVEYDRMVALGMFEDVP